MEWIKCGAMYLFAAQGFGHGITSGSESSRSFFVASQCISATPLAAFGSVCGFKPALLPLLECVAVASSQSSGISSSNVCCHSRSRLLFSLSRLCSSFSVLAVGAFNPIPSHPSTLAAPSTQCLVSTVYLIFFCWPRLRCVCQIPPFIISIHPIPSKFAAPAFWPPSAVLKLAS